MLSHGSMQFPDNITPPGLSQWKSYNAKKKSPSEGL